MKSLLYFVSTYDEASGEYIDPEAKVRCDVSCRGLEVSLEIPGEKDRGVAGECPNVFFERRNGMWVVILQSNAYTDGDVIVRIKDDQTVTVEPQSGSVSIVTP